MRNVNVYSLHTICSARNSVFSKRGIRLVMLKSLAGNIMTDILRGMNVVVYFQHKLCSTRTSLTVIDRFGSSLRVRILIRFESDVLCVDNLLRCAKV